MATEHPVDNLAVTELVAHSRGGPTVMRILLGSQLRRMRLARGISREDAGFAIRASHAKITRLERGQVGFKIRDVEDLLTLYGLTDPKERAAMIDLVRQANAHGWWHKHSDVLPSWFNVYMGLEEAASVIRAFEVQFVPGLLQTEAYARAVIGLSRTATTTAEIDSRVDMRMRRKERLLEGGSRLWAVIDEAGLRRPYGGDDVLREQLDHLIQLADHPRVTIQLAPFSMGGHPAAGGPFTILRFASDQLPDIVYLEQLASALYLDKYEETHGYTEIMDHVTIQAPVPAETPALLARIRDSLP
ncbi:helix-turn-helix domain-containing protein [Spiractinospora alimapuensis]|uniref:helix-turn-helix domain-containing protein n=1 Tax=Spiractinospora alimapuensis TaxID=2820884 RepID=UPI001F34F8CE|nr:helix-turn-helix transcriptional regulator [Spiractinospora alimapuensis]QVQ54457.1 helix-turn-helix domain-containing protein [Spiractinospora alimapuensis]